MAMTNDHVNLYNDLGTAAGLLDQRAAEYSAKSVAALAASQALETARAQLDAAVIGFNEKNAGFDSAMLTLPAGYTPPV
jgi:hypothetical protein